MEKHDKHIANIEKLEDEIRKLAIPYVSEEPDPLYWANFRVRVMDSVSPKEAKAGFLDSIQQFLAGHIWGSSIAISAAALLVAGVMIFNPFGGDAPQMMAVSAPVAVALPAAPAPAAPAPAAPAQLAKPDLAAVQTDVQDQSKDHVTNRAHRRDMVKQHEESANVDLAMVGEPVEPAENTVSLDELSTPQLEAIEQDLENNE
jgi:hypothetical protein